MTSGRFQRLEHQARKGVEAALRSANVAPEQRAARILARESALRLALPGRDAPKVLMLSARDWAAHVHYEAVIGHGLRARGADVRFVTCGGGLELCDRVNTYEGPPMPCTSCARYTETSIRAHGFPVRRLSDLWDSDEGGWPELDELSRPDLRGVEDRGVPLGELVDVPLKWFLCAAALDDDPLAGVTQRSMLRSARRIARATDRLLDEWTPDVVVMLSGLFLFEAIMWNRCRARGIDAVSYERAFRQETLVFSRDAPAGFYEFADAFARDDRALTSAESTELDAYVADRRRGDAFDQHWSFDEQEVSRPTGRLGVAFTNLTWDSAVVDRDVAFADIRAWIDCLIEEFADRPEDSLVIRVHPSEVRLPMKATRDSMMDHLARAHPILPPNVTVIAPDDLTSSYPLMGAADVGLVYTSTTGLELALAGTPVIVAGAVHYRGQGFTNDVETEPEFRALLRTALDEPTTLTVDAERARRYAHFFWFRAPVRAVGVVEPIPGLARLTIERFDELEPGANPDLDHICGAILDRDRSFVRSEPSLGVAAAETFGVR